MSLRRLFRSADPNSSATFTEMLRFLPADDCMDTTAIANRQLKAKLDALHALIAARRLVLRCIHAHATLSL